MDAKQLYREKLLTLATMGRHIDGLLACLSDLSTIEERFPDPDHGDLYELMAEVGEVQALIDNLAAAVGPLAE